MLYVGLNRVGMEGGCKMDKTSFLLTKWEEGHINKQL